jgi:hypothetical protein
VRPIETAPPRSRHLGIDGRLKMSVVLFGHLRLVSLAKPSTWRIERDINVLPREKQIEVMPHSVKASASAPPRA